MNKMLNAYTQNISSEEFMKIFVIKLSTKTYALSKIVESLQQDGQKIKIEKNIVTKYISDEQYVLCDNDQNVCIYVCDLIELRANIFNDIIFALTVFVSESKNKELSNFFLNLTISLKSFYFANDFEAIYKLSKKILN